MTTHSIYRPVQRVLKRALLLLVACVVLVACGQTSLGQRGQVVVAWHTLDGAKAQVLLDLIDEFNRTNPDGITIVPEHRAVEALHNDVLAGIERKALPSLVLASPMQAAIYQQQRILAPLNDYIADPAESVGWNDADRADLYPFVLRAGRAANGQIVGIPFGGIVRVMLFNRDWLKTLNLDDAPADWERFTAACNAATDRTKGTLCFGLTPTSITFEQFLAAYGGQVTTDDMSVLQVSTPVAIASMNSLASYVRANQAYRVTTLRQSRDDFATTRVLFTFDWSDGLLDAAATVKKRADFDWGVGLLPGDGHKVTTKYSAPLWVMTRVADRPNPDREKAAWLFVRWLTSPAQTAHWSAQTNELPARLSAINILGAKQALLPNQVTLLRNIVPQARPDPLVSGWRCIENTLSTGLRQILDGQPVTPTLQLTQAIGQPQLAQDCSTQ
jgi:multiple sugar transport system substrate-binding protein